MTNEERIIQLLEEMNGRMGQMEGRMGQMEGRMGQMEGRMDRMEGRMDRMEGRMDRMETRLDKVEADTSGTRILIEQKIEKQLGLLAEGHTLLLETLSPKSRVENLEEEVVVLKQAVRMLSQDVAELKGA